jgi:hypothetical protein
MSTSAHACGKTAHTFSRHQEGKQCAYTHRQCAYISTGVYVEKNNSNHRNKFLRKYAGLMCKRRKLLTKHEEESGACIDLGEVTTK